VPRCRGRRGSVRAAGNDGGGLAATEAPRGAENLLAVGLGQRLLLAGAGTRLVGPLRFASWTLQRTLEDHFDLGARGMLTSAPRVKRATRPAAASPAPAPSRPPARGWPPSRPPMEPMVAPVGTATLAVFGCVAAFVAAAILLDGAFVTVDFLVFSAGHAVDDAGISTTEPLEKIMEVKCMLSWAFFGADAAAGADDAVDDSLDIDAGGNDDAVADDDREDRGEIDTVAGAGAFGVDGAADFEEDSCSRGNIDDVGGGGRCGHGCGRRRYGGGLGGSGCRLGGGRGRCSRGRSRSRSRAALFARRQPGFPRAGMR